MTEAIKWKITGFRVISGIFSDYVPVPITPLIFATTTNTSNARIILLGFVIATPSAWEIDLATKVPKVEPAPKRVKSCTGR